MSKLRTIKFRGFNKKRGIWLYGNYILNRGAHFIAPQEFADGKTWEDYEVEEESIGQFTGLHDKNGKEIYEGDIINVFTYNIFKSGTRRKLVVRWTQTEYVAFDESQVHTGGWMLWQIHNEDKDIEVIGNIHDNPDLIEKGGKHDNS